MACILIIDDDESVRTMLALMLECLGHDTVEAVNGAMGVRLFRARPFDLVFTDLIMPGKDGLEVISDIHGFSPDMGIVAMSGAVVGPEVEPGVACARGPVRMMQKPFTLATLEALVTDLLVN